MGLDDTQLRHFERLLKERKQALEQAGHTGDAAERVVTLDQSRVGRLSRMDAMQAQAMSIETGRRRRLQIASIETALARLAGNEYGLCLGCGEDIHHGRLEADPAATLCIGCAEARE